MLTFHAETDTGCVRQDNEDRFLLDGDLGFFAVADGMGGHRHGELAAELALATMRYYVESSCTRTDVTWPFGYNISQSLDANRLTTAIRLANRQVWKRAEEGPEFAGMGTTVAAALIDGTQAAIANVGDSRVYLFRAGCLRQLTCDDTWLSAVIQQERLDSAALANHPMRNVLTQAAGSQYEVEVHTTDVQLEDGDVLLLSTDGLHGLVRDDGMRSILGMGPEVKEVAATLVSAARSAGAPDNATCVLVRYAS
jgi:protein phosphatase